MVLSLIVAMAGLGTQFINLGLVLCWNAKMQVEMEERLSVIAVDSRFHFTVLYELRGQWSIYKDWMIHINPSYRLKYGSWVQNKTEMPFFGYWSQN